MTLHIGIAACSAEGAALCYKTICVEAAALLRRDHAHPEVSLHSPSLADYMDCIYRDDWRGVGDLMVASADKLKRIGADFAICPDNTIHQAMPHVLPRSPLPWLHIAEEVATEAARRGFARIGLTGTKYGCGIEVCGACTVIINGQREHSCVIDAAWAAGKKIVTIEGLSTDNSHPVQKAWIDNQVPQCGYCQSGQIMRAAALLKENPRPTREQIVSYMKTNICRCGSYRRIIAAIERAAKEG